MTRKTPTERAWQARLNQDIATCEDLFAGQREPDVPSERRSFLLWADYFLLKASILRARGEVDRAREVMVRIENLSLELGCPLPTRFYLERGLNALFVSNYCSALENFQRAQTANGDLVSRAQSLLNEIIAREYLHLSNDSTRKRFEKLFNKNRSPLCGLTDQWQAFQLRTLFRDGDFKAILRFEPQPTSQGFYFKTWLMHLPYFLNFSDKRNSAGLIETGKRLYLASYRLRTLAGIVHPDDQNVQWLSQKVERFYLWTWYWLTRNDFPLSKLKSLCEEIVHQGLEAKAGFEDRLLLRNAAEWISLFDSQNELGLQGFLESLNSSDHKQEFLFLDYEFLLIRLLKARLKKDWATLHDLERLIDAHPISTSPHLVLGDLLKQTFSPGHVLAELMRRIQKLGDIDRHASLMVDMRSCKIKTSTHNIFSPTAARALFLLARSSSVTAEVFLQTCFEIRGYDTHYHYTKITNLLARLRPLLPPGLTLHFRDGRIYSTGDWSSIRIEDRPTYLGSGERWFAEIIPPAIAKSAKQLPAEVRSLKKFTRRELEERLRKPRSTVNRLLSSWQRDGLIRSHGQARSTEYIVTEDSI